MIEVDPKLKEQAQAFLAELVELCAKYDVWPAGTTASEPGARLTIELSRSDNTMFGWLRAYGDVGAASLNVNVPGGMFTCGYRKKKEG